MRAIIPMLAMLLVAPGSKVIAQATPLEAPAAAVQAEPVPAPAASVTEPENVSSGLPVRSAQARTMRAYWHVFIAFTLTWLLLFGYALTLGRRFGRLELEVRSLRDGS